MSNKVYINCVDAVIIRDDLSFKLDPLIIRLIEFFIAHADQTITRKDLAEQVWQSNHTSDDAINRGVSALRKALANKRDAFITTIPKVGYRFTIPENIHLAFIDRNGHGDQSINSPVQPEHMPVSNTLASDPEQSSAKARINPILGLAFIAMVFISLIIYWQHGDSDKDGDLPTVATKTIDDKLTLVVEPMITSTTELNVEALQQELINSLIQINTIKVLAHDITSQRVNARLKLKASLREDQQQLKLTIRIIDTLDNSLRLSSTINQPKDDISNYEEQLLLQGSALIRVALQHPERMRRYASALDKLSHVDFEQLIQASIYIGQVSPGSSTKGFEILQQLDSKYPNTAEVLGMLSYSYLRLGLHTFDNKVNINKQLALANRAIEIKPFDFSGLKSLFYYYYYQPQYADQTDNIILALIRHHPTEPATWRAKLLLMISTARPCHEIRQVIGDIPQGIFSDYRLEVINQILDACQSEQPHLKIDQMWQALFSQDNELVRRATKRHLLLFNARTDLAHEINEYQAKRVLGVRTLNHLYRTHLRLGDHKGAKILGARIEQQSQVQWFGSAANIAELYDQPKLKQRSHQIQVERDYGLLYGIEELYLVASYIKTNNQQGLMDYLRHRPKFAITLANREGSVALMMAHYNVGQLQESQEIARKLYDHLEVYRNKHIESHRYWGVSSYQFIASIYCGQQCQTHDHADIKANPIFSNSHLWWLDDLGLVKVALAPWKDKPQVQSYINQIRQDAKRAKTRLGL